MSKLRSLAKNAARKALNEDDRAEIHDDVAVRRNMKKQDAEIDKRESAATQQVATYPYKPTDEQNLVKKSVTRTLNAGELSEGKEPVWDLEEKVAEHFENLSQWELWSLIRQDWLKSNKGD